MYPKKTKLCSSRQFTLRFGTVPEDVETRLQTLNLNQLEELLEISLRVDAIAQFTNHLP
ncbi:DUF4351 domain-containing protein [Allocoleopsis sp.]|uniref:DUF4351 domain-containing protein n=1 Tax=Allocoleopsis sp. TaxID=3088169 RepID=UPI002FD3449F